MYCKSILLYTYIFIELNIQHISLTLYISLFKIIETHIYINYIK